MRLRRCGRFPRLPPDPGAAWPAGLAAGLIAWHGLAGNPGYRLAGSRSAMWRLPTSESADFRDLARPDQVDLRILPRNVA